ncbi:hypothetical protein VMCG_00335 [Cytospora schulzeri]|uniref:Uncharacterized protein n=1 Tax=Cytospora schulzeri TaxID=448051 RepID=A0A423X8N4_9PEZI|nr:hypothetical protein VMCG_00335 [Valsa malicola]
MLPFFTVGWLGPLPSPSLLSGQGTDDAHVQPRELQRYGPGTEDKGHGSRCLLTKYKCDIFEVSTMSNREISFRSYISGPHRSPYSAVTTPSGGGLKRNHRRDAQADHESTVHGDHHGLHIDTTYPPEKAALTKTKATLVDEFMKLRADSSPKGKLLCQPGKE